jgi:hypothetical protein
MAFRRGEENTLAQVGALIESEFMLRVISALTRK